MSRSVPEWEGAHPDVDIPPRVKLRIFERCGGRCQRCTRKVGGADKFAYDHIVALANGGAHAEGNLQVLCAECHAMKTARDVSEKAAVARVRAKHLGIRKPSRFQSRGFTKSEPQHSATRPIQRKEPS